MRRGMTKEELAHKKAAADTVRLELEYTTAKEYLLRIGTYTEQLHEKVSSLPPPEKRMLPEWQLAMSFQFLNTRLKALEDYCRLFV